MAEPRIWSCFTFFDELDHLEARLELLDGLVAGHIVCEGTHTHQGDPKPLHLDGVDLPGNVIRCVADLGAFTDPWERENAQRDFIGKYVWQGLLADGSPFDLDDILIVSDADEHPNPEIVPLLAGATAGGPISLSMRMHYYSLGWEDAGLPYGWLHPKALRARDLPSSLSDLRLAHMSDGHGPALPRAMMRAGWHASYTGDAGRRAAKLRAYAHAEQNNPTTHARVADGPETGTGPNGEALTRVTDRSGIPDALVRRFG